MSPPPLLRQPRWVSQVTFVAILRSHDDAPAPCILRRFAQQAIARFQLPRADGACIDRFGRQYLVEQFSDQPLARFDELRVNAGDIDLTQINTPGADLP
ncbi:hypothetical protein ABIB38_004866 [Massilia sp. UYP11]